MYERSAMQHTIFAPRRFSDANFDGSSFMRIRGKMANRERGLHFPLIWINVK
jgi:hypothetical protein